MIWLAVIAAPLCGAGLPYDLVAVETGLSQEQQRTVERFLKESAARLASDDPAEVAEARRDMTEPLTRAGVTEVFRMAYASSVGIMLEDVITSENPVVRLNAMIVIASVGDVGVMSLAEQGLGDPSPAVRYWAAGAVARASERERIDELEQRALLQAMVTAMVNETSEVVLQRLLIGLVGLTIPEAAGQLLDGLNDRVGVHAARPDAPLEASLVALRTQFVRTVESVSNGTEVPRENIRRLALVAYRYLTLSGLHLDGGRLSEATQDSYRRMIELTSKVLPWAVGRLASGVAQPDDLKNALLERDWGQVCLRAEEWRHLLRAPPCEFTAEELDVSFPEAD